MPEQVMVGRDPQGRPVYVEAPTSEETIERFQASDEYRVFAQKYDTGNPGNQTLLRMLIADRLGDDPTVDDYRRLVRAVVQAGGVVTLRTIKNSTGEVLLTAGQYEFVERPVAEPKAVVEEPAPVHRGQQLWSEYRRFSESHSTQDCRNRAKVDAGFASFMRKNYEREARETESTQFQLAGQPSADNKPKVTPELVAFAEEFRRTSMDQVRKLKSPGLNPLGWESYVKSMDAAFAAGLI